MPELGTKFECFSCGAKFYDLGKPEPLCPKCGANQKEARKQELANDQAAKRRRREELVRATVDEEEELIPGAADVDLSDEELVTPEGVEGEPEESEDGDLDDVE
jgi:uncharacterized protein (TIGR02300 family)